MIAVIPLQSRVNRRGGCRKDYSGLSGGLFIFALNGFANISLRAGKGNLLTAMSEKSSKKVMSRQQFRVKFKIRVQIG